jgi:diguanylate cyclase (GGDEF)-like protein
VTPGTGTIGRLPAARDDLSMMRRVAVAMFLLGGITAVIGMQTAVNDPTGEAVQRIVAVLLIVTAIVLLAIPRPKRWLLQAADLWGITIITVLAGLTDPLGRSEFFYLWPVVFAAYYFSVRFLVVAYGWMCVSLAVALYFHTHHPVKIDVFVGTITTVGLMATLVATLTAQDTRLRDELAQAAETDPLTGLLNRRSFNPMLEALTADTLHRDRRLSLVMIDIDHFKALNDEHGHLIGDRALQEVAAVLRDHSRDEDLVCRFGGEEFVVVLPGASAAHARSFTERVARALHGLDDNGTPRISVSAGIASLGPDATTPESLIERADAALYAAKAAGRCRQAIWNGEILVGPRFGEATPV